MTATDITPYTGGQADEYQARIVMTPEDARALDEQVRRCTEAVLQEGTDYGVIPGTNGEKTLWRPGAQKLLQWFGLGFSCDRIEVERDDDGRKHGITYKCTVARRLPDGSLDIKATCEGTADYDESKFYQTAEEVQRKAEATERMWAEKDRRVANPNKSKNRGEYRADWNALMKRAQKRAIVGAVVDATAAGGIFADREEDETPAPQDDGPSWYEQALEDALTFTDQEAGRTLFVEAAQAARDGLCTPRQANHIQNRIQRRAGLLKRATPVDVEDLARQAGNGEARQETAAAGDDTRSQPRDSRHGRGGPDREADENGAAPDSAAAGAAPPRVPQPLPPLPGEDDEIPTNGGAATSATAPANGGGSSATSTDLEPGEAAEYGTERHRKLVGVVRAHFKRLGYTDDDDTQRLEHTAKLAATTDEMRKRREHREDVWAKSNGIFRDGKFHPEKK